MHLIPLLMTYNSLTKEQAARRPPHRTHDPRSSSQDHHPIQRVGAENHMLQLNI